MDDNVKDAVEMYESASQGWFDIYQAAKGDADFLFGNNQWEAGVKQARLALGRHCITIDRLIPFVNQVSNDIRQNTPTIKVLPADSQADLETAEMMQDMVRNIEYISSADEAYDTAAYNAITTGIGFIRVDHDYVSPETFEQHILIKRVANSLSVLIDPSIMTSDGSDSQYGFVTDEIHEDEFKKLYPDAVAENFDTKNMAKEFRTQDKYIKIAEFFKIKEEEREIVQLENGLVVFSDNLEAIQTSRVLQSRKIKKNCVYRQKLTGAEVLEETKFPSSYIPLIPVFGQESWVDGKRQLNSLIRNSKDSQRMYNYWASLETELLQKAPKSPYLMVEGQAEGYEAAWANPDAENVLTYKQVDLKGQLAPAPSRIAPPPVPTGIVNARNSCVDDIKATMGMYDASIGNEGSERSGKAILARQRQGNTATFHFGDNLRRSVTHVGRIVLDMIPRVYDTPRIIRTIGEDGAPKSAMINGSVQTNEPDKFKRIHDIRVGKYDCIVTTGPSFSSKREQAADAMLQLASTVPMMGEVAPDLIVQTLDIPGADALAKRLKKAVPPQFMEPEEEGQDPEAMMAKAQAMLQQADQTIQQLQMQMQEMDKALVEAEAKERDNSMQAQVKAGELELKSAELQLKQKEAEINLYKIESELALKKQELALKTMQAGQDIQAKESDNTAQVQIAALEAEKEVLLKQLETGQYVPPDIVGQIGSMKEAEANNTLVMAQALENLGNTLAQMAVIQNQPKQVVRDESGRITAIQ